MDDEGGKIDKGEDCGDDADLESFEFGVGEEGCDRLPAVALNISQESATPKDEGGCEEVGDPLFGKFATCAFEEFCGHEGLAPRRSFFTGVRLVCRNCGDLGGGVSGTFWDEVELGTF